MIEADSRPPRFDLHFYSQLVICFEQIENATPALTVKAA